jgi:hypothetical protein
MTNYHWVMPTLAGALFLAVFQASVHQLLTAPFDVAGRVLGRFHGWLADGGAALRATRGRLLSDIELDDGRWRTSYLLGACIGLVVLITLAASESVLVGLSMESLGLGVMHLPPVLARVDSVLLAALIVNALWGLWGLKAWAPDSRSHLIVTHWYSASARRLLRACAAIATAGVLVSVLALAVIRSVGLDEVARLQANAQVEAEAQTAGTDAIDRDSYRTTAHVTRMAVGTSAAVAVLAGAAVAFAVTMDGLAMAPVLLIALALGAVAWIRWTVAFVGVVVAAVRQLISLTVRALVWLATPLARPPVELLRRTYAWAAKASPNNALSRAGTGIVASLAAMGNDFQVPPLRGGAPAWQNAEQTKD